jgi:oligopeptide/dipeptide ABC transporter ATP-binding protein
MPLGALLPGQEVLAQVARSPVEETQLRGGAPLAEHHETGFVLDVDGLAVVFPTEDGPLKVVDDVTFRVRSGKTLAIVGESGCGKSVTSLAIMGLLKEASAKIFARRLQLRDRSGGVVDLQSASEKRLQQLRGCDMAMIFQEPMTSLNPSHTVGRQIGEVLQIHRSYSAGQARAAAIAMLARVGIPDAAKRVDAYPHEMSGGMRQRVMIAIALTCNPTLMIADEPTTALDVTIQAQIIDELRRLQDKLGMAMLFITHDFGVVAELAHDVAVMYAGEVVEEGPVGTVMRRPRHPYTRGLLNSVPRPDQDRVGELAAIPGRVPDVRDMPAGCRFHPRCNFFQPGRCDGAVPPLEPVRDFHKVRCVRWQELDLAE